MFSCFVSLIVYSQRFCPKQKSHFGRVRFITKEDSDCPAWNLKPKLTQCLVAFFHSSIAEIVLMLSIHPSSSVNSGNFPLPGNFLSLLWGDPEAFPCQPKDVVFPACPAGQVGHAQYTSPDRPLGGILTRYPSHFNWLLSKLEEQRLYSNAAPGDLASHLISVTVKSIVFFNLFKSIKGSIVTFFKIDRL